MRELQPFTSPSYKSSGIYKFEALLLGSSLEKRVINPAESRHDPRTERIVPLSHFMTVSECRDPTSGFDHGYVAFKPLRDGISTGSMTLIIQQSVLATTDHVRCLLKDGYKCWVLNRFFSFLYPKASNHLSQSAIRHIEKSK